MILHKIQSELIDFENSITFSFEETFLLILYKKALEMSKDPVRFSYPIKEFALSDEYQRFKN